MSDRILPRRFHLLRLDDVHGVSGEGVVAEGVQLTSGQCVLAWLTPLTSVAVYHSVDVLDKIHGHDGKTLVLFDDPKNEHSNERVKCDTCGDTHLMNQKSKAG